MERQQHGFDFEQLVAGIWGIELSNQYTSKWDGRMNGFPVSIKLEKYKSDVELGDYFRNAATEEDFYLIVGFWQDEPDNIIEFHILFIDGTEWHTLFPNIFSNSFSNLLAAISNEKSDDDLWREQITILKQQWVNSTNNLIRPRFKRDHKKQKRVQCAINNKDFYRHFLPKYSTEVS